VLSLAVVCLGGPATLRGQEDTIRDELWPEVDLFVRLNDHSRLFLLGTLARNRNEGYAEGTVGAHLDAFVAPIVRPWLRHTPDADKRRFLSLRLGYRHGWDLERPSGSKEHRAILEATGRFPPKAGFMLVNRHRLDLRSVDGERSWRYRPRLRLEHEFPVRSRAATAYVMAEVFYDSRYEAWTRKRYSGGVEWPLRGRGVLDTYYCRQDDKQSSIAHVNALGLALNLFF
jgi:hypothetical protein